MMPTIASITTTVFRLPMEGALSWGKASRLDEARHVLVQVALSDGSTGVAEAPPRPTIYGETEASITSIAARAMHLENAFTSTSFGPSWPTNRPPAT